MARTILTTHRTSDFFSREGYFAQVGVTRDCLVEELTRQLIDNGLDAAESEGTPPEITVELGADSFSVSDNGPGLPEEILRKSLDYSARTSTNAGYVTISRGRQGHALQTIWPAGYVATGCLQPLPVVVETPVGRFDVSFTINDLNGTPEFEVEASAGEGREGTRVSIEWPDPLGQLEDRIRTLLDAYSLGNHHAGFRLVVDGREVHAIEGEGKRSSRVGNASLIEWYSREDFEGVLRDCHRSSPALTIRQFVANFQGLSRKGPTIATAAGLEAVAELFSDDRGTLRPERVKALYRAMASEAKAVEIKKFGAIGRKGFRRHFERVRPDAGEFKYKATEVVHDRKPFLIEVASVFDPSADSGRCDVVLNSSPWIGRYSEPEFISDGMGRFRASGVPVGAALAVSIISPGLVFTDRNKSEPDLPSTVSEAVSEILEHVLGKAARRERAAIKQVRSPRKKGKTTYGLRDACFEVLPEAYEKAAGSQGRANARQIMYAVRQLVLSRYQGLKFYANDAAFTQKTLPEYLAANPEATAGWKVCYDSRGHLVEPHSGRTVPLGTVSVDEYVERFTAGDSDDPVGPVDRYSGVLFIEKEGFEDIIAASQIRERYDIATVSTKGHATVASRRLLEELSRHNVPVFVMSDFDLDGLLIAEALSTDTARFAFDDRPTVHRLGMTLELADKFGLKGEPWTEKPTTSGKPRKDPRERLREIGCSDREIAFLVEGNRKGCWHGRRIELNELTADQFIQVVEEGLERHGVEKVVPNDPERLSDALRDRVTSIRVERRLAEYRRKIEAEERARRDSVEVPADIVGVISERIAGTPDPWQRALGDLAREVDATK